MAWETTFNIAPKHLGVYNRSVFPYPKSRVLGPRAEVGTPANRQFVEGPSVDGSEIRRLPVDMVSILYFTLGFLHPGWWSPDVFHQQYVKLIISSNCFFSSVVFEPGPSDEQNVNMELQPRKRLQNNKGSPRHHLVLLFGLRQVISNINRSALKKRELKWDDGHHLALTISALNLRSQISTKIPAVCSFCFMRWFLIPVVGSGNFFGWAETPDQTFLGIRHWRSRALSLKGIHWIYPAPQDASKWRFSAGFPTKNVIIWVMVSNIACVILTENQGNDSQSDVRIFFSWNWVAQASTSHPWKVSVLILGRCLPGNSLAGDLFGMA